jgi:hypothetical protein
MNTKPAGATMAQLQHDAASAAALLRATSREHIEGDTVLIEDIQLHLNALRLQATRISSPMLRATMSAEIGCAEQVLRHFFIVRSDPPAIRWADESLPSS